MLGLRSGIKGWAASARSLAAAVAFDSPRYRRPPALSPAQMTAGRPAALHQRLDQRTYRRPHRSRQAHRHAAQLPARADQAGTAQAQEWPQAALSRPAAVSGASPAAAWRALSAAAHATTARKARAKPPPEKRRTRRPDVTAPPTVTPAPAPSLPDQPSPQPEQHDDVPVLIDAIAGTSVDQAVEEVQPAGPPSFALEIEPVAVDTVESRTRRQPRSFIQKLRDWLRRDT